MTTLLLIVWLLGALLLICVLAVRPERTKHSWFELQRRQDMRAMRRERYFDMLGYIRLVTALLIVSILAIIAFVLWQGWGTIALLALLFFAGPISRLRFIRSVATKRYVKIEPALIDAVEKSVLLRWLTAGKRFNPQADKLESEEQLLHLIESSADILSDDQRKIMRHGIDWHRTTVKSVMTNRSDIVSIKHSELLGPLVLDDLHRTGHNRFPVIKGNLDTVIGILDISELLEIDAGKKSTTAEKSMQPQALRIEADRSLPEALALLQKSHQHLLIVIDQNGKTVGMITLSDITRSLLGK